MLFGLWEETRGPGVIQANMEKHANSTQKRSWPPGLNPDLSCCEVKVLTTVPPQKCANKQMHFYCILSILYIQAYRGRSCQSFHEEAVVSSNEEDNLTHL